MCDKTTVPPEEFIKKIPLSVFNAGRDRAGYFARVSFHAATSENYREAWERTEAELAEYGFMPHYSSYESFRTGRTVYLRDRNAQREIDAKKQNSNE